MHYARWRKHRDVGGADRLKAPPGEGRFFNDDGYVLTWVPKAAGGYRIKRVHRLVMEQMLGRPLRDFENVHHINGIRDDNRPENLELWVKAQPSGQRAADLAEWVLDTYPELVEAARANRRQLRLIEGDIA